MRSALRSRTSEGKVSFDAERAQSPFGGRAGKRALAASASAMAAAFAQAAKVNIQPLPSSVVTLSDAQIAEIKG